jgi:GlpG protein
MRQIGTLPDEAARRLADYLLTLKIETRLQPEEGGTGLWVCDEDRVPQARQELEAFQRNPSDPRYGEASAAADQLRRQEERTERDYRRRQQRASEQMARAVAGGTRLLTVGLLVLAVLVTTVTKFGKRDIVLTQELLITNPRSLADYLPLLELNWPPLPEVASGQVWRLVTPIFLHFDLLHLVFNLLMFLSLGGQVESARGSGRFLLLVLVLAVVSNLTQFYLGHPALEGGRLVLHHNPYGGGLSGVIYGLFGYVWVKGRLEPHLGMGVSPQTVVILMIWFIACFFMKDIGNGAHAGGLAAGLLIAALTARRRR